MHNIISFINKKANDKFAFLRLGVAEYDKGNKTLKVIFYYPDEIGEIKEEDRKIIEDLTKEFVDLEVSITLKFVKSFYDQSYLKTVINNYIENSYISLKKIIKTESLSFVEVDQTVNVKLDFFGGYVSKSQLGNFVMNLEKHLTSTFMRVFKIELNETKEQLNSGILTERQEEAIANNNVVEVKVQTLKIEVIDQLIGTETSVTPLAVGSITSAQKEVSVGGTISNLQERSFKRKQKTAEGNEVEVEKVFYKFNLVCAGKSIECAYFPNKQTLEKAKLLEDNKDYVITGDIEIFNNNLNVKVKHITRVKILEKPKEEDNFKPVPKVYKEIKPEPYTAVGQASLFETFEQLNDYVENNTFIVFDLETTGLNHEDSKITEIGAVKIVKGKITEKFATFVDPEVEIPLEITRITGITDAMVMGAPKIETAIADFYKFCEGSTLVAYNIDFDYKFINYNGRKNGYNFNHNQKDALVLARQYIKGLKNYKLKTVCEALNVNLSNAHRAYYDAAATAKVFLKLAKNL